MTLVGFSMGTGEVVRYLTRHGAAVRHVQDRFGVSERRGCMALRFHRSSQRYRATRDDQAPLRLRIREIAAVRVRYGYPRIRILLLVPGPDGRAWSQRRFATAWDRALRRADHQIARDALRAQPLPRAKRTRQREAAKRAIRGRLLTGLQRRDIRRTGMVQLALADATIPRIAALSGHSIEHTTRIIET